LTERFIRTQMLLKEEGLKRLARSRVLLFGVGGVGGYAAEALARSGVGAITLVDNDRIAPSNINRQIIATDETLGKLKTEVMQERIRTINPDCRVTCHKVFYLPGTEGIITKDYDYILDAVDTVSAKIDIIMKAQALDVPIISCMGTGNKLRPELLQLEDLFNTSVCPLCRVMRHELKKRGVTRLSVVFSPEEPLKPEQALNGADPRTPGSVSFVPPVAGLLMASRVIRDLAAIE